MLTAHEGDPLDVQGAKGPSPVTGEGTHQGPWRNLAITVVLAAIPVALLLFFGWRFLQDPSRLAPTRDPAWYTWRTRALLDTGPAVLIDKQGPFGMFSGGYRVTTPILGALLHRIAGVDPLRFTVMLAVGLPVLTSLALGAFAFRHTHDHLLSILTTLAAAPLFLTVPFIGYLDNLMALFILAVALSFLEPARDSWAARSALALLLFLATLTHPTTAVLFGLTLVAWTGLRWIGNRLSVKKLLDREGPTLLASALGIGLGMIAWRLGLWGPKATLSDAVLTQPYTADFFRGRLTGWVRSLHPEFTVPVAALGVTWVLWRLARRRTVDRHSGMSALWLLPLIGVYGYLLGYTYPYYRFINVTLAPMLLLGLGVWVLTRPLWWLGDRIRDRWRVVPAAGVVLLLLALGALYYRPGQRLWDRQGSWASPRILATLAAAQGYAEQEPDRPIVFVIHPKTEVMRAWGLAKQSSNVILAGLAGSQVPRTYLYVGEPADFLAGRPTVTGYPIFDRLSRGFLADLQAGLGGYAASPIAFYLPSLNASGQPPPESAAVEVVPGLQILTGPGLADPSSMGVAAAEQAGAIETRELTAPRGRFDDPGHLLRVVLGLFLVLVLPGLVAMTWFHLDDAPSQLALIPGLSFALVTMSAVLVVAVHRGPFGAAEAWASIALATAAAGVMAFLGRRRTPAPDEVPSTVPVADALHR
jgi:hypothetical protein